MNIIAKNIIYEHNKRYFAADGECEIHKTLFLGELVI